MKPIIRPLVVAVGYVALSFVLVVPAFAQADSQVGTWKLNLAKSKYSPGPRAEERDDHHHTPQARAPRWLSIRSRPMARVRHWEFTANYDGKDSKMTGNNPDADTVARTRIDASTVQTVSKKNGKVTTTQTSTVSADGKTRTVATKGVNARGPASEQCRDDDKQ